jgi:hypothetical protein
MPPFYQTINEKIANGEYLNRHEMVAMFSVSNRKAIIKLLEKYYKNFSAARGSSHNHQDWEGGYLDHVVETMNIACQLYYRFNTIRGLPFVLADALLVLFLHDLEKPFKHGKILTLCDCGAECSCPTIPATKENRKEFRANLIKTYGITLSPEQENALRYVEGVPDSEYTPGERTMGELAAFCHCCDILSARLWYDRGREQAW